MSLMDAPQAQGQLTMGRNQSFRIRIPSRAVVTKKIFEMNAAGNDGNDPWGNIHKADKKVMYP